MNKAYIEEKTDVYMEMLRKQLIARCQSHEEKIEVKDIDLALTNRCNCYCVMCPFTSAETKKTGILNEAGEMVSLEHFKKIITDKIGDNYDKEYLISFMSGETFLNPDTYEILKYIKEQYPCCKVEVLSNATVPPKQPDIVKYIDTLAFSIDGASKEVYEKIRTPAKYEHMVNTLNHWMEAIKEYNPDIMLVTSTTLSTLNFRELPDIIKMVARIAESHGIKWTQVYCQNVVIEEYQPAWLKEITLDHIDCETGRSVLSEAEAVAEEYGVSLSVAESVKRFFEDDNKIQFMQNISQMQRFCKKLESGVISYDSIGKGEQRFACCFMDTRYYKKILQEYNIDLHGNVDQVYNSEGYWKMRQDMLEGKLTWLCRDCMLGCEDYFMMRNQVKLIVIQEEIERLQKLQDTEESY